MPGFAIFLQNFRQFPGSFNARAYSRSLDCLFKRSSQTVPTFVSLYTTIQKQRIHSITNFTILGEK